MSLNPVPTSHPRTAAAWTGTGTPTGAGVSCPADGTTRNGAHASPSAPTSAGHTIYAHHDDRDGTPQGTAPVMVRNRRLNRGNFTIGACA